MTVDCFRRNLSGTNGGQDFDQDMLVAMFNAIKFVVYHISLSLFILGRKKSLCLPSRRVLSRRTTFGRCCYDEEKPPKVSSSMHPPAGTITPCSISSGDLPFPRLASSSGRLIMTLFSKYAVPFNPSKVTSESSQRLQKVCLYCRLFRHGKRV